MVSKISKVPRLIGGKDLTRLTLSPKEGYVVSQIDGAASVDMLADLTNLEPAQVIEIVDRLIERDVAEWVFETVSLPQSTGRPAIRTPVLPFSPPAFLRQDPSEVPREKKVRVGRIRPESEVPVGGGVHHGEGIGSEEIVGASRPSAAPRTSHTGGSIYPAGEVEDNTEDEANPFGGVQTEPDEEDGGASLEETIAALNRVAFNIEENQTIAELNQLVGSLEDTSAMAELSRVTASLQDTPVPPRGSSSAPPSKPPSRPPSKPGGNGSAGIDQALAEELDRMAATLATAAQISAEKHSPLHFEEGLDLDRDRQKQINDLYFALDLLDHYQALGVERTADKKEIRNSYFALSKMFHPDTMFRKNLGSFKAKMESVFKRLTEAYDVLGKKRARRDYDRYLGLQDRTRVVDGMAANSERDRVGRDAAKAASALVGASLQGIPIVREQPSETDASSSPPPVAEPEARAPEPEPPPRAMSAKGIAAKKRLMAQRLRGAARASHASRTRPKERERRPAGAPVKVARSAVLRDLSESLKATAFHTGGVDMLARYLNTARRAESQGQLSEAADALRLAMALAPEDPDIQYEHKRVHLELAASLADEFEEQAQYETKNEKWAAAALSWARVFEGRPGDATAARLAANALLNANGDLHKAKELAQAAYQLEGDNPRNHVVLAKVFIAANLGLNARRVLQEAAELDPENQIVENLLRTVKDAKS